MNKLEFRGWLAIILGNILMLREYGVTGTTISILGSIMLFMSFFHKDK